MIRNTSTAYTENWDAERAHLKGFSPEKMADICGIDAETLRDVARVFAGGKAGHDLLGYGRVAAYPRHGQFTLSD